MKLVDELFSHFVPKEEALLFYGFSRTKDGFFCQKKVMGEAFDLLLTVRGNALFAKLLDADFGDEYRRIDTEEEVGGFVADLRRECEVLLLDLRDRCFETRNFVFEQSNRLAAHIKQVYGVDPEFLWEDSPDCGVFRNQTTQKWFGILMYIDRKKILPGEVGKVEVVNLKLDGMVEESLRTKGVFPAYHMTKKNWVSVILDDTLPDEEIARLVAISFANSDAKKKK